jgi:nucleoside-diphosphate-sugar epimerase
MSSSETILFVGGTGELGKPVARQMLADGYSVRLLVRTPERARTLLGPEFEYFAGDVGDSTAIERALDGCAGVHVSLRGNSSSPEELDRVEHQGTARVAELAARQGVSRLTYLSSMLVAKDAEILGDRAKFRGASNPPKRRSVHHLQAHVLYGNAAKARPGQTYHRLGQATPPLAHSRRVRFRADGVQVI